MAAWRTTGRWCNASWKPSGKPTTSSGLPTSTSSSLPCRCAGVKQRSATWGGSASRSSSITATSMSPPSSRPWRQMLWPSR
jgi:hypothetical protein